MIFNFIAAGIGIGLWAWFFYQLIEIVIELKEDYNERKNR